MVRRKVRVSKRGAAAAQTPASSPDAAPSSSRLSSPPQAKTTQKRVIADLQHDNAALHTKMDAIDSKLSVLGAQLSGLVQQPQALEIAAETSQEPLSTTDQASTSSQGTDPVLPGGDEEAKRRRMEQQMVDAGG